MNVLKHLLFLVAAIITGRADVIPDRTRRDGKQVPVGGKVGASGSSSVNPNIDAQLTTQKVFYGVYENITDYDEFLKNQPPVSYYYTRTGISQPDTDYYSKDFKGSGYKGEWITPSPDDFKFYEAHIQAERKKKIEADALAQQNGEPKYKKQTLANSMVQTNKGLEVTPPPVPYGGTFIGISQPDTDYYSKDFKGSGYKGEWITPSPDDFKFYEAHIQAERKKKIEADALAQENGEPKYQTQTQANSMVQTNKGVKVSEVNSDAEHGAKYSESALYADTGIYNDGSLNGEGLQVNAKSHLQSGVQFGGAVGAETVAQPGIVMETRFGQSTHPPRRPRPGFGYRQPYNVWNHG